MLTSKPTERPVTTSDWRRADVDDATKARALNTAFCHLTSTQLTASSVAAVSPSCTDEPTMNEVIPDGQHG